MSSDVLHKKYSTEQLREMAWKLFDWMCLHDWAIYSTEFKFLPSGIRNARTARGLLQWLWSIGYVEIIAQGARGEPSAWVVTSLCRRYP